MKKINLKKKILFSLVGMSVVGTSIVSATSFANLNLSSNEISKNNVALNSTSEAQTNGATANIIPWNQTSTGDVDFSTPRQHIAFDNTNSSYAILNSNSSAAQGVLASSSSQSFDNLTKFDMTTGQKVWSKSASGLTVADGQKNTIINSGKYLATAFLQNTTGRTSRVLSIVQGTSSTLDSNGNQLFLVAMDWSNGNVLSIQTISNAQESMLETNQDTQYFINVNNFINLNITISAVSVNAGILKYSSAIVNKLDQNQITFNNSNVSDEISKKFFSSQEVALSISYVDASNLYFVFQQKSIAKENFITILKVGKNQNASSISSSNIMSISLTDEQIKLFSENKKQETNNITITLAEGKNNQKYLLVSKKQDTQQLDSETEIQNNYLVVGFNNNNFGNSTSPIFKTLKASDNGFIVDLQTLYSTSGEILGYIGLSSSNKAINFASDFSSNQIYYDFGTLKTEPQNNNKIYTIFTRENDANWYAQMTDGSIIQFSGSNLIGQLDKISGSERTEILASVSFKEESEVSPSIIYKKTSDNDFKSFISQNASNFLNINSYDPVFGQPILTADVKTNNLTGQGNQKVTIAFYQNLRQRASNGDISDSNKKVLLGTQTYTFINDNMDVKVKDKSQIPVSITSKYPSEVTVEDVEQILDIENNSNYEISLQPNDGVGVLTVNITSPYAWIAGSLQVNYKQSVTIGSADQPYFMVDVLNGLDGSVNLATQDYLETNNELMTNLSIKYGTVLPSSVSAENVLNDLVILGDAFNDMQLINQGLIEKPTTSNIQIVPVDTEGYMYITVTIPKVGTKTNLTYSFKSAAIFSKSATSKQNAYIIFKDTDEVKQTSITTGNTTQTLGSYLPSTIAQQINSNQEWLLYFANVSYYVLNMIYSKDPSSQEEDAKLNIATNDGLGQITISIEFTKPVPGLDGTTFKKTFDGFATQGNSGAPSTDTAYPSFSWKEIDANAFNGKTPSDITVETIQGLNLFNLNGNANSLKRDITVEPLNSSGAVLVTVTFYNWWEKQKKTDTAEEVPVLLPQKTFQTILTNGLSKAKESVNTIVWKSYEELEDNIKNSTAANALVTINSGSTNDIDKLKKVANVSESLEKQLNVKGNSLTLSITANNSLGYIEAFAKFNINGTSQSFSTKISGFNLESSNYVVTLASDTSEVAGELKNYLPSQLTDEQIGSLINVQLGNNLSKKITTEYDDINGTLKVRVELLQKNPDGSISTNNPVVERTYSGFKTNIPQYKGTNYLIVSLSIVIPFVLLLSPILFILFYKNRQDIRRFSKVLDKRLSEQQKKKKHIEVNTIEDLLSLDND